MNELGDSLPYFVKYRRKYLWDIRADWPSDSLGLVATRYDSPKLAVLTFLTHESRRRECWKGVILRAHALDTGVSPYA